MDAHGQASPTETIVERLATLARSAPDRPAYTFLPRGEGDGTTWTFGELHRQARRVAAHLHGIPPGSRVLLVHPPGLEFLAAFFGCLHAGVIAVPVCPPRANQAFEGLERIALDADACAAVTTPALHERLAGAITGSAALARMAWLTAEAPAGEAGDGPRPSMDAVAYLQYTSGSTGTPKGVMVTHHNLVHNFQAIAEGGGSSPATVAVCWLPLFHDMGLVGSLEVGYAGGHTILLPPLHVLQRPVRWLDAITRFRAERSGSPNFFYDLCARTVTDAERGRLDLSSWEVAVNGAEQVRAETLDRFVEAFGPVGFRREAFRPSYGLAESTVFVTGVRRQSEPVVRCFSGSALAGGSATLTHADAADARRLVGCGRPPRGSAIAIVDPQTHEALPDGKVGEIWTRGASVAAGYWGRPDESPKVFDAALAGGAGARYLRTGDLGFVFEGNLFVTGRLKDLVIIRGTNHDPGDIERTMHRAHRDLEGELGAAFSIERNGEEQLAVVHELRRRPRSDGEAAALVDRIREAIIAGHGIRPHVIRLVRRGTIPRTTSGKVRRHACREQLASGSFDIWAGDNVQEPGTTT
jgi:acyl-CoA synthetase (AMP-forming)/AMP-acid ligase II